MPASAITMGGTADHDGAEWAITMSETCTSESKRLSVLTAHDERLLRFAPPLPLEKPVHDHETAALAERLTVGRCPRDGLDPHVDPPSALPVPAGENETPAQEFESMRLADDGDRLGRRNVESWRKLRQLTEPERLPKILGGC
jgi:hypothetical protein